MISPFDNTFYKSTIGFDVDRLIDALSIDPKKIPTYPPYNVKKVNETTYVIELAVAGFQKSEIEIELVPDGTLLVRGQVKDNDDTGYLFKGIAQRNFIHTFTLAESVEVKNADLVNGMLKIWLERLLPPEKKAKKIEIGVPEEQNLLQEVKTEEKKKTGK